MEADLMEPVIAAIKAARPLMTAPVAGRPLPMDGIEEQVVIRAVKLYGLQMRAAGLRSVPCYWVGIGLDEGATCANEADYQTCVRCQILAEVERQIPGGQAWMTVEQQR